MLNGPVDAERAPVAEHQDDRLADSLERFEELLLVAREVEADAAGRLAANLVGLAEGGHDHVCFARRSHGLGDSGTLTLGRRLLEDVALRKALAFHGDALDIVHAGLGAELAADPRQDRHIIQPLGTVARPPAVRVVGQWTCDEDAADVLAKRKE